MVFLPSQARSAAWHRAVLFFGVRLAIASAEGTGVHWVSNVIVVLLIAGGVAAARHALRDRFWRENAIQLWRRRSWAIGVVGLYLLIALADSVAWIDPPSEANALTSGRPRTIIDRIFRPETFKEASYSAPLADLAFYRMLKGVRVALLIGGLTSLVVIPIALLFGVSAGFFGRRIDDAVFFAMTVLASVPTLLLLIALIMVLGRGTLQVCVALGVTGWVHFCRIARGETLKLREADYVAAARALGVREGAIIRRHILPNIAHLIIITFALSFTGLVLSETILSYLGIGLDGSWGQMIDQARNELSRTPIIWWNLAGASLALFALVLAVNMIADAMRDIADPRTRREER
jgi:peptide/nickel transport system permease protein